ncbi:MAG: hypothetical protein ACLFUP_06110, partial [Desulfobacteraceae bacterium]
MEAQEALEITNKDTTPGAFLETVRRRGDCVAMRKKELGLWHDITWNDYYAMVRDLGSALI